MCDLIKASAAAEAIPPGTVLGDRYRIEDKIGEGGMGAVYRAQPLSPGQPVAIKVMRPDPDDDGHQRHRFIRGAALIAQIRSPHVVELFDVGTYGDLVYSVMEYLRGENLAQRLWREVFMPWPEVREVVGEVVGGLRSACGAGILHRDIKPSNIFLARAHDAAPARVKLLDFGLAKPTDSGSSSVPELTAPDVVLGTLRYMAPERGLGAPASVRSEIYSVGAIMFECLTGQVPHDADRPLDIMLRRMREPAPSMREFLPGLAREVDEIVTRALEPDPARRFSSFEELADAVREATT